jgi:hypothetical protein
MKPSSLKWADMGHLWDIWDILARHEPVDTPDAYASVMPHSGGRKWAKGKETAQKWLK